MIMVNYKANMPGLLLFISILLITGCSQTDKLDRSKMPEPGEAPETKLGDYQTVKLDNGMTVFIVKDEESPVVSYKFEIDRDPIQEGEKSGFVSLAGSMLGKATEKRSKDELNEDIDFIGADFSTNSKGLFASALKKYREDLLNISADVLTNPVFKEETFEKAKRKKLSGLQASENEPSAIASKVYGKLLFGSDHPYGDITSEETVNNVKMEDIEDYYEKYFTPSNAYMAIVGDVNKDKIKSMVEAAFGDWKGDKSGKEQAYDDREAKDEKQVAVVDRSSAAQSTLRIGHPVQLRRKDDNYFAAKIANTILGSNNFRLFMNLREEHAYTYGAYSRLSADQEVGKFTAIADVDNDATDSAIDQILKEMAKMRKDKVKPAELERAKNYITGNFAIELEDASTMAEYAINKAKYDLPEDYYKNYLKNIDAVTRGAVKSAAKDYIKPEKSQILVVGKSEEFQGKLQKYGDVKYYDKYGNPVEMSENMELDSDMNAKKVINQYIQARGGAEKLTDLEAYSLTYQTTIRNRTLKIDQVKKAPNLYKQKTVVGGMKQQEKVFDGEKAVVNSMRSGKKTLEGRQLKKSEINAHMFYLTKMDELGIEAELKGIETINNKPAYKVELSAGKELTWTEYFSKSTSLRVAEKREQKTPKGMTTTTTYYKDYETKNGIKFPGTISQSMGGRTINLNLLVTNLNPDLSKSEFQIKDK